MPDGTMADEERPGPLPLTEADIPERPPLGDEAPEDEGPAGPPPLTEDIAQERPPSDFESPGRADTEGIELDRSTFVPSNPQSTEAPPPPPPPAEAVAETVASDMGRLLGSGAALLLALVVCPLPANWRARICRHLGDLPLRAATVITGVAEMSAAFFLGLQAMLDFMQARLAEIGPALMNHVLKHDLPPQTMYEMHQVQGAVLWIAFLLSPAGLLLAFFMLEGATRVLGATVAREAWGILPLWLVEKARWLVAQPWERSRQQPLPPDEIVKDGQGILDSIRSARAYAWDRATTLSFEGRLYVVEEQSRGADPERPYHYRVREARMGDLIRKLTEYAPAP